MVRRRRLTLVVLVAAALAVMTSAVAADTAPGVSPSDAPLHVAGIVGSPDGVAWEVGRDDLGVRTGEVFYSAFNGAQRVDAGPSDYYGLAGQYGFTLAHNQLYAVGPTGNSGLNIATGQSLPVRSQYCVRSGAGCFEIQITDFAAHYTYTPDSTGVARTYDPVPLAGTSPTGDQVSVDAIDQNGVVLEVQGDRSSPPIEAATLDYLDFATGDYTVLDDTNYASSAFAALDAGYVAWIHDEHVFYLDRNDPSASAQAAETDGAVRSLALNGRKLAYSTVSPDTNSDTTPELSTIHTGIIGGPSFTAITTPQVASPELVPVNDGDFAAVSGSTVTDYGLYRVLPGATALGPVIAPFGFADSRFAFPNATDVPPDDLTAVGATVPAVIDPTTFTWTVDGAPVPLRFGTSGDIPAVVDPVGQGVAQVGVFRPSTGTWYTTQLGVMTSVRWGQAGDIPVASHYTGVGVTDYAVFRPSNGRWYLKGSPSFTYGAAGDIPVPGTYYQDSAGLWPAQPAVFRPSTGTWFIRGHAGVQFGQRGDIPVPGDYDGNGTTDLAVYRPSTNTWYVRGQAAVHFGTSGDIPVTGDFTGVGHVDIAVYRPSTSTWYVRGLSSFTFGNPGDVPVEAAPDHD